MNLSSAAAGLHVVCETLTAQNGNRSTHVFDLGSSRPFIAFCAISRIEGHGVFDDRDDVYAAITDVDGTANGVDTAVVSGNGQKVTFTVFSKDYARVTGSCTVIYV